MANNWEPVKSHCPNCGAIVTGYRKANGISKMKCTQCGACLALFRIGRRHIRIEMYAP